MALRTEALKKTAVRPLGTNANTQGVHAARAVPYIGSAFLILINSAVGATFDIVNTQKGSASRVVLGRGERTRIPLRHQLQLFLCLSPVDFADQSIHAVPKDICLNRDTIISLNHLIDPASYFFFEELEFCPGFRIGRKS